MGQEGAKPYDEEKALSPIIIKYSAELYKLKIKPERRIRESGDWDLAITLKPGGGVGGGGLHNAFDGRYEGSCRYPPL
jgi:hypothetical protein